MASSLRKDKIPNNISEAYLHKLYVKELDSIDLLVKSCKEYFDVSGKAKIDFFYSFFHLCLYSTLTQGDLSILMKRYRLAKRSHEKSLFARLIAMTAIEFFNDMNTLVGRDLLKFLSKEYYKEFVPVFKGISKELNELKKKNEKMLRQIRNNGTAHKSLDSLKFLDSTYGINMDLLYILGSDIKRISAKMTQELVKVNFKNLEVTTEAFRLLALLQEEEKIKK